MCLALLGVSAIFDVRITFSGYGDPRWTPPDGNPAPRELDCQLGTETGTPPLHVRTVLLRERGNDVGTGHRAGRSSARQPRRQRPGHRVSRVRWPQGRAAHPRPSGRPVVRERGLWTGGELSGDQLAPNRRSRVSGGHLDVTCRMWRRREGGNGLPVTSVRRGTERLSDLVTRPGWNRGRRDPVGSALARSAAVQRPHGSDSRGALPVRRHSREQMVVSYFGGEPRGLRAVGETTG